MASILDISDTLLENLVTELNYPEHAALPIIEFDNVENNRCNDLLDVLHSLDSPASPLNVASHHVGQNFRGIGNLNWDSDKISCSDDEDIMKAEKATPDELTSQVVPNLSDLKYNNFDSAKSKSNICWNVGGDLMQLEQATPLEITSKVCQSLGALGRVNYDSGWSSRIISWNVGGSVMRAEQAAPGERTSPVGLSLSDLGYSGTSNCNVSWNGMTKRNSLCDPLQKEFNSTLRNPTPSVFNLNVRKRTNASVLFSDQVRTLSKCSIVNQMSLDALVRSQLDEVLSRARDTTPVDSTEQLEDTSQLDKCQVQLIGKSSKIPPKNATKDRRNESTSYPCAECGRQFSRRSYLTEHLRVHTGEKPYKCWQCDYVSTRLSSVYKHQSVHSDVRPFKCLICNGAFKTKLILTRHQRTHSGERPYECGVCNKTFGQKFSLSNHSKLHKK